VIERGDSFSKAVFHLLRCQPECRHQGSTECLLVKILDWGCRPISDTHFAKLTSSKLPFARRSSHGAEEPPTTFVAQDQPARLHCTRSLASAGRLI
jgi:hypothetical protein